MYSHRAIARNFHSSTRTFAPPRAMLIIRIVRFSDRIIGTAFAAYDSVAPGLYLRWAVVQKVGRIVDFRIPSSARQNIVSRAGHDGGQWYILKPIVANPRDQVDTTRSSLVINGRAIAPMPPDLDGAGRHLPSWRENRVLGPDGYVVFTARIPNSFDRRCYDPVTGTKIAYVRRPP